MSAYMVGATHIDALLTAGMHRAYINGSPLYWYRDEAGNQTAQLTLHTVGRVGAMLLNENRESVNYRYSEDELEEPYEYKRLDGYPNPLVILRALANYEYQACEHPGWETSEAKRFCDTLQARAISILTKDTDVWEIVSPKVFLDYAKKTAPVS